MVSIYVLLIVFLITLLVAAAIGRSWFDRRMRRPQLLRKISLVVVGTLLVKNLACFILDAPEFWRTINLTATLGALSTMGIVMTALRTGGVPDRQPGRVLAIGAHPVTWNRPAAGSGPSSSIPGTRFRALL